MCSLQFIVPILHVFSCDDLNPRALPGDWSECYKGCDEETGKLPYYQTLVMVRCACSCIAPRWSLTALGAAGVSLVHTHAQAGAHRAQGGSCAVAWVVCVSHGVTVCVCVCAMPNPQRRRNQPPFFREQTLLLYCLQIALAILHCDLYKIRPRIRFKEGAYCTVRYSAPASMCMRVLTTGWVQSISVKGCVALTYPHQNSPPRICCEPLVSPIIRRRARSRSGLNVRARALCFAAWVGEPLNAPRVGTSEIDPQQGAGAAPKHTFRGGLREADMGDQGRATAPVPIWERHASRPASARPKPNSIVDTDDPRFPYAAARAW